MTMAQIEDAIKAIEAAGYKLNNLFQRHDGHWQANLHKGGKGTDFGLSMKGPYEAIMAALNKVAETPLNVFE